MPQRTWEAGLPLLSCAGFYTKLLRRVASKLTRKCDSQMPAEPVIMQNNPNEEPL